MFLSVENKPSILTHLGHFITCGKGNENIFRTNKKSFCEQSLQLVIVAHFSSIKLCHGISQERKFKGVMPKFPL